MLPDEQPLRFSCKISLDIYKILSDSSTWAVHFRSIVSRVKNHRFQQYQETVEDLRLVVAFKNAELEEKQKIILAKDEILLIKNNLNEHYERILGIRK